MAVTLLKSTLAQMPKPAANTPATQITFGTTIMCQLRFTFVWRLRAMSRSSHRWASPSSRKTIWAVSVAIVEAPRSEIDTLAFLSAIESLMPSPTKQTFRPSAWSLSTYSALSAGSTCAK